MQVEVGVELLELSLARVLERLLERVAQGARGGLIAARAGAMTAACRFVGVFGRGWVGRSDDRAVLACGAVKRFELAVRDPDELREQLIQRVEIPVAEDLPPHIAKPVQDGRVDDAVVGARLQIDGRAPAMSRVSGWPAIAAARSCSANAGRITSVTAAASAWRMNRPRSVPVGCSRTPWASMRGSSSSRRSIASCRSPASL